MSLIKKAAILLFVLLGIPIGVVFLRPDLVLSTLAKSTAAQLGYEISSMTVSHLGLNSLNIEELSLLSADQGLQFRDILVEYSLSDLLSAQVQSLHVSEIDVLLLSVPEQAGEASALTVSAMLATLDALPTAALTLPRISVRSDEGNYKIDLSLQSPPLQIQGSAQLNSLADASFEFELESSSLDALDIQLRTLLHNELAVEIDIHAIASEDRLQVTGSSTIFAAPLRRQFDQLLTASTVVQNDSLSLAANFEIVDLFGELSIPNFTLDVNSPSSALHIEQQVELGSSELQLRLPIHAQGSVENLAGSVQFGLSPIYGSGSWLQDSSQLQAETLLENTQVNCKSLLSCDLRTDWQSQLINWKSGTYSGEELSLNGALQLNYAHEEIRITADLIDISIPTFRGAEDSVAVDFSTSLQLDQLELTVGDSISAGFNYASSDLQLGNKLIDLKNPAYSGKLQFEKELLTGILEFELNQGLRFELGLQHFFPKDTGDVIFELARHDFSEAEPLSDFLSLKQFDGDIVAGEVSAQANISWSKQVDQSWRLGGPISLRLDKLSAYFAEYFVVDLSTDMFAEATTPLGIQVVNPTSASISRVDVGLPIENLSWQYRFNSLTGELEISDLDLSVLGGKLSIASARYHPDRARQQIDVVLANLNVQSMVNLVDYPGLQADGLISGYLPFILEGNKITIHQGLLGALNPGGSIRYRPANSTPASNPGMRLVNEALSNYQYQHMNTEASYDENGDLLLKVQLQGANPDMNSGQAINLNVNITDNIPTLLKSLQASRDITDELERVMQRPH